MLDLFVSLFAFLWNLENKVLLRWLRPITLNSTLIIPDITKTY